MTVLIRKEPKSGLKNNMDIGLCSSRFCLIEQTIKSIRVGMRSFSLCHNKEDER